MSFLLSLLVLVVIAVFPVMLAARLMEAERTAFGPAVLAVILQLALAVVVQLMFDTGIISLLVALLASSALYAFVLGTTILRGFLIGIIATIIAIVTAFMLGSSFALLSI